MAVDIGPKIGITGESEFRKQIRQVNEQIKTLGTEMKATEAAFEGQEKTEEALTAKSRILTEEIAKQREKVALLTRGLQESAEKYGENDERTLKWQQAVNNATAQLSRMEHELDATTAELNSEGKAADDAGKETKDAGDDAEDSAKGWKALGSTVEAVGAAMAAAAAAAAAAIAAAAKALVSFTVDGAAYADAVLTMASVTGMTAEKVQELQYAAELVDVSVETITGSMKKNLAAMTKVQNGNASLTAIYDRLGVAVTDANGKLRDDETVYWELIDALGRVDDETERDALAMQVLGKSAQELNPLIEAGSERMGEFADMAHEAGYVLSEDALEAFSDFDDAAKRLSTGATAAKNALGTVLLPILTDLAGDGVDLLGEFTRGILDADGDIGKMTEVVGQVLPKVLNSVMRFIPEILDLTITILGGIGKSILDNLDLIISSVGELFQQVLESVFGSGAMGQLVDGALTLISTLAQGLLDNLGLIIQAGLDMVIALVTGLAQQAPALIPAAVEALMTVVDTLTDPDNLVNLIDAALQLIIALAEGLISALPKLLAKAPEILSNLVQAIIRAAPMLLKAALELILTLGKGIVDGLGELIRKGGEIVDSVKQGFMEKVEAAKNWGRDLIQNFISGITAKWQDLKNTVSNIAGTIKSFLGFSEPEKGPLSDFHTFAPDMIDLFIQGLQQGQRRLQAQMEKTFDPAGMTAGIADVTVGGVGGMAVEIPLNIDGQTLTRVIAQIQWAQGTASVRNYGGSIA